MLEVVQFVILVAYFFSDPIYSEKEAIFILNN